MWYYSVNGQSFGPLAEADLDAQVASGAMPADVYVWQQGMADWRPYHEVISVAAASAAAPAAGLRLSLALDQTSAAEPAILAGTQEIQGEMAMASQAGRSESFRAWGMVVVVVVAMFGFLGVLSSRPHLAVREDQSAGEAKTDEKEEKELRKSIRSALVLNKLNASVRLTRLGSVSIRNDGGFDWPATTVSFESTGTNYSYKLKSLARNTTTSISLIQFASSTGAKYDPGFLTPKPQDIVINVRGHGAATAHIGR